MSARGTAGVVHYRGRGEAPKRSGGGDGQVERLDGPNVRFTNFEQMLFRSGKHSSSECFSVGLSVENQTSVNVRYCRGRGQPIDVESMTIKTSKGVFEWREGDFEFDPKSWSSDGFS